jgi:MinD-like ATPase involved in chromosome partitioning or flagellar assembly
MSKGKIIGIISIKGGVGKTTAVSNLGAVLANEFGKKVLLVDANFTAPNL